MTKKTAILYQGEPTFVLAMASAIHSLAEKNADSDFHFYSTKQCLEYAPLLPHLDAFFELSSFSAADYQAIYDFSTGDSVFPGLENSSWKMYFHIQNELGSLNPYHVVDLFRKLAGVDNVNAGHDLLPASLTPSEDIQAAIRPENGGLRIGICCDSITEEEIACCIRSLNQLDFALCVSFMGTLKSRRSLHSALEKASPNFSHLDFCGRLNSLQVSSITQNIDLVIAGQGQIALLASGYGTFTVCLSSSPAGGQLMNPYGHGHLVLHAEDTEKFLECLEPLLKDLISYAVLENGGTIPSVEQWEQFFDKKIDSLLGKICAWSTQRIETKLSNSDSPTELGYKPQIFSGSTPNDVFRVFYKLLFELKFNQRNLESKELGILHLSTAQVLRSYLTPMEHLFELGRFGQVYCDQVTAALAQNNPAAAKTSSSRLQEIDELLYAIGRQYPFLNPMAVFHQRRQELLPALGTKEMADEIKFLYQDLQDSVLVLLDLTQSLFHTSYQNEISLSQQTLEGGTVHV